MIFERIAEETGIRKETLLKVAASANHRYKSYRIDKKTSGYRTIEHPTPELKFLQRWLNRNVFCVLKQHKKAMGYRTGVNIADNARIHARNNFLLKIDFADFFPSLREEDVRLVLSKHSLGSLEDLTDDDVDSILRIVCRRGALTIGAPSSPVLSNAILYEFDCFVFGMCSEHDIQYTRYADDLFLSTNRPNRLSRALGKIRRDLQERKSPTLTINDSKTVFTSRKRKRIVTGVVLTPEGELSIGRAKKRSIRTRVHLYAAGKLTPEEVSYLRGYLAFARSVEPKFLNRLRKKFGGQTLDNLLTEVPKRRKPAPSRKRQRRS